MERAKSLNEVLAANHITDLASLKMALFLLLEEGATDLSYVEGACRAVNGLKAVGDFEEAKVALDSPIIHPEEDNVEVGEDGRYFDRTTGLTCGGTWTCSVKDAKGKTCKGRPGHILATGRIICTCNHEGF